METLSMEFLRIEFVSIFVGFNENLYLFEEQLFQLLSSFSEQSFYLRDSLNSNSSFRIDVRDSRLFLSFSEFIISFIQKDFFRVEFSSYRGFQIFFYYRKFLIFIRYQFICMLCLFSGCGIKNFCMIINLYVLLIILFVCLDF